MIQVICRECGFPIATRGGEGDTISCPSCGATGILTKIGDVGSVEVPDPLFFGILGFGLGLFLGPALIKASKKLGG